MPDEQQKTQNGLGAVLNTQFISELLKQGQLFFLLCVFIYLAAVGIPKAWFEVRSFLTDTQQKYESLADKNNTKLDETRRAFETSIEKLVAEMKAGNEAMEKLAEAEEAENIRADAERRARGSP